MNQGGAGASTRFARGAHAVMIGAANSLARLRRPGLNFPISE
jgi:hypothetical protein